MAEFSPDLPVVGALAEAVVQEQLETVGVLTADRRQQDMKMVLACVGLDLCESQLAKALVFKPRLQIDADFSGCRVGVAVFLRTDIGITGNRSSTSNT